MTLLTLGASKINQGDLQRGPKGELNKGNTFFSGSITVGAS